jgi:hypothetical protein
MLLAAEAVAEDACDAPPDAALIGTAVLAAALLAEAALEELLADELPADAEAPVDTAAEAPGNLGAGAPQIPTPRGPNDSTRDEPPLDGAVPVGSAGNNVLNL